jgi:hypothetical protein
MNLRLLLAVLTACQIVLAQKSGTETNIPSPGMKEVQVPFSSLKSTAAFKVGGTCRLGPCYG